jgi:hypothetical protein
MLGRTRQWLVLLSRPQKIAIMLAADFIALPTCLIVAYYLRLGDGITFG